MMDEKTPEDLQRYLQRAVRDVPRAWNARHANRSGLRAAFRRWRPDATREPTMEMRDAVWAYAPPEGANVAGYDPNKAVDQAAVIVAMRAVIGEGEGPTFALGEALHGAGISDLRFTRFVTTPGPMRLEALYRTLRTIARSGKAVDFQKETTRIHSFLFGRDDQARRAANIWASDYFRARSAATGTDIDEITSTTTPTSED